MSDLCVIVPSRGRPENVKRLVEAWKETGATADLQVVMDNDDWSMTEDDVNALMGDEGPSFLTLTWGPRIRLGPTLNREALLRAEEYRFVGFMGDDHSPRTDVWDKRICEALASCWGPGIVYANDLFQGINLPTAVFMDSRIVKTLGYMCPPSLTHMWLDNSWKAWGESIGPHRLQYLPEVIIEHVHPQAGGKAPMDAGYAEVWPLMEPDKIAYDEYMRGQFVVDVEKLRDLR